MRQNSNIKPDPEDPSFYCCSCQKLYKTRGNFRQHIRLFHPITELGSIKKRLPLVINPLMVQMDAGNPKNKSCTVCERDYKSRNRYCHHMKIVHKDGKRESVGASKRRSIDDSVIPIWDDPGLYCRSCKKSYSNLRLIGIISRNFTATLYKKQSSFHYQQPPLHDGEPSVKHNNIGYSSMLLLLLSKQQNYIAQATTKILYE